MTDDGGRRSGGGQRAGRSVTGWPVPGGQLTRRQRKRGTVLPYGRTIDSSTLMPANPEVRRSAPISVHQRLIIPGIGLDCAGFGMVSRGGAEGAETEEPTRRRVAAAFPVRAGRGWYRPWINSAFSAPPREQFRGRISARSLPALRSLRFNGPEGLNGCAVQLPRSCLQAGSYLGRSDLCELLRLRALCDVPSSAVGALIS